MTAETTRLRLSVFGVVIISLFAALFARLWYLQVMDSETFVEAAGHNQVRIVYEQAPRGRVLDRQGRLLVDNRFPNVITLSRVAAAEHPEVIGRLATLLAVPIADIEARLDDPRFSPYKPVPVAHDVPEDTLVFILEHQADFGGVEAAQIAERVYPNGPLAAHLLGYVGQTNPDELQQLRSRGYREGDEVGKAGVELAYEPYLRGRPGVTKLEVDSRGRVLGPPLGKDDPVQGNDVQLTIDLDVQRLVEDSLAQGLEAVRGSFDRERKKLFTAPAGAAVVLDPSDGGVLAMASFPTYDPTLFVNGIRSADFKALQDPAGHFPLNNRAIQGQYAPGSTFKLVTALAAMDRGLIDPRTTFDDQGAFRLKNCRGDRCIFRNAGGIHHGRVNLTRALTVSSDVFFYTLGASFWTQRDQLGDGMQLMARRLGMGAKSGVPLLGEKRGRVPDPESRRRLHEENPKAFPNGQWRTGDNINLAIGQGELVVTPLQLANAYATFANGGVLHEPKTAARVLDRRGKAVAAIDAAPPQHVQLPASAIGPIMAGLKGVVLGDGTAAGAFAGFPLTAFPVAGKTGTAQVFGKQDTALFVGFAPADAPRYVIAVVMEESGFGGSAAAPVARRILQGLAGSPPGPVTLAGSVD